jgi:arginine deiminase
MPARNLQELHKKITHKAAKLVDRFGKGESSTLDLIMDILIEDANEYGEEGAIRLNSVLSETETDLLPMCNLLFGRDQSNMLVNAIVWSKMSKEIRDPEVSLWKFSLNEYLKNQKGVEVTGDGRLEGGDIIIHNGNCLIGVGGRTNETGVMQVAPEIFNQGLNVYAIYHPERASGNMEHQTTMHLDTFYMPAPKNTCVVLLDEAKDRQVIQVKGKNSNLDGQVITNFEKYLIESGADIIPISREQQLNYQANFVVLDKKTVLVTTKDNYLRGEFEKRGIIVIDGNLDEITQGYGGAHCSLTPILRI